MADDWRPVANRIRRLAGTCLGHVSIAGPQLCWQEKTLSDYRVISEQRIDGLRIRLWLPTKGGQILLDGTSKRTPDCKKRAGNHEGRGPEHSMEEYARVVLGTERDGA